MINREEVIKVCASNCCWKQDYINGDSVAAEILDRILPQEITPYSLLECIPRLAEEPVCMIYIRQDEYDDYCGRHWVVGADDAGWVFRNIMSQLDYGWFWSYLKNIMRPTDVARSTLTCPEGPSKRMVENFFWQSVHSSVCDSRITKVISCVLSAYENDIPWDGVTFQYLYDAVSKGVANEE